MILELCDSIVSDLEAITSDELDALTDIALKRANGTHTIVGKRSTVILLAKMDRLGKHIQSHYTKIYGELSTIGSLPSRMTSRFILTRDVLDVEVSDCEGVTYFKVPLMRYFEYGLDNKNKLISEHNNDVRFFVGTVRSYAKLYKIKPQNIYAKPVSGGGNSTYETVASHINDREGFTVCILDSDYDSPSAELGNTAKQVLELDIPLQYVKPVINTYRETENIIPFGIIEEVIGNNVPNIQTLSKLRTISTLTVNDTNPIRFVDFKKGIKLKSMYQDCPDISSYWREVFEQSGIKTPCRSSSSCSRIRDCSCQLVQGLGTDLLRHCAEYVEQNSFDFSSIEIHVKEELEKICEAILPYVYQPAPRAC
ncbi:TPA: hypothetical protein NKW06_003673 [Vibrio parahaemolyticus]|nr:hypothetical protein [Vibrio parahaemolyticus]HCM1282088.1 hypothetical protein [Vibrio parahaemolyticus]